LLVSEDIVLFSFVN